MLLNVQRAKIYAWLILCKIKTTEHFGLEYVAEASCFSSLPFYSQINLDRITNTADKNKTCNYRLFFAM